VSPPLGADDLDVKIKEIAEKREKYIVDGEKRLQDEVEADF